MFVRRRQAEQTHEKDMRKTEETGESKAKANAEPEKYGSDGFTQFDAERQADMNDKINAVEQHKIIDGMTTSTKMKYTIERELRMSFSEIERKAQEAAKHRDDDEENEAKIEGVPPIDDAKHPHRDKTQGQVFTKARKCCRASRSTRM